MDGFNDVDGATLRDGRVDWMDDAAASRLARHPLEAVDTEYPHYVGSVEGPTDVARPREDHPVFFGCFDWHSAVHSHWSLVRQLRLFDDHPDADAIRRSIDERLTPDGIATEVAYFEENPGFEKPYGWVWLLRLAAELRLWERGSTSRVGDRGTSSDPARWGRILSPLEDRIVELVRTEFLPQSRPFRVGTHGNSAFALAGILDYASVVGHDDLATEASATARRFFADDERYPVAYEPLGWDFLSPALTEADLMRRVLDDGAFASWLDDFLPDSPLSTGSAILDPVPVDPDSADGVALHLVGLNVSKAWCLAGIAEALPDGRRTGALERAADRHARYGVERSFTDAYAGSHWLSSFVLYLASRTEGGIAPSG